ncbi:hypothetical protein ACJX0J_033573 [Zea mays]
MRLSWHKVNPTCACDVISLKGVYNMEHEILGMPRETFSFGCFGWCYHTKNRFQYQKKWKNGVSIYDISAVAYYKHISVLFRVVFRIYTVDNTIYKITIKKRVGGFVGYLYAQKLHE